jgi:hypothetical protein
MTLTNEELHYARTWVAECDWADLDDEDVAELTDEEIVDGIEAHYEGGVEQFKKDA